MGWQNFIIVAHADFGMEEHESYSHNFTVHGVPEEFSTFLEDTHVSKVPFTLIKHIFFETLRANFSSCGQVGR